MMQYLANLYVKSAMIHKNKAFASAPEPEKFRCTMV